jgi:hypothetical protein
MTKKRSVGNSVLQSSDVMEIISPQADVINWIRYAERIDSHEVSGNLLKTSFQRKRFRLV